MTDAGTLPEAVRTTPAALLAEQPAGAPPRPGRRWLSAVIRTAGLYLVTLWAAVTLVFLLPRAIPGDPLQSLDDPGNPSFVYDPVIRERVAAYYGLDRPLLEQYASYLSEVAHGDLGWSISQKTRVITLIARRLPWTLLLTGGAVALSSVISFLAGLTAAWRRGGLVDKGLIVSLAALRAIPEYAIATALLIAFAVFLPVFPQAGAQTAFAQYPTVFDQIGDILRHLVLPLAALTLGLAGNQFLLVRNTAISTLGEDYMILARAKGLPPRLLKYRHSGRNSMLPLVSSLGAFAGLTVGPSLFVEAIFSYPGMGTLLSNAVVARDYPLLQGGFLVLGVAVLVINFLVDLAYQWLDPRVTR